MDKENLEYMECLYEMATVRPLSSLDSFGIPLAINPDTHNGDAYFKMYNSTSFYNATTVWRIKFEKAEFIKEQRENRCELTHLSKIDKREGFPLISFIACSLFTICALISSLDIL